MKSKKIIFPLILILSLGMAFAYTKLNKTSISKKEATIMPLTPPNQEILGTWHLEDSSTDTYEFLSNGIKNTYSDNVLLYSSTYEITTTCNNFSSSDPNDIFLKETDQDGFENCYLINGINENNSGMMSLMDERGKIIILVRQ